MYRAARHRSALLAFNLALVLEDLGRDQEAISAYRESLALDPGMHEAHHGKRVIPLHVPPTRTVHLALGEAGRTADRAQTIAVYVVAVTADGTPRSGAAIGEWPIVWP